MTAAKPRVLREAHARIDALTAERNSLVSDVRDLLTIADERGEALERIGRVVGMAPHPLLVAEQVERVIAEARRRAEDARDAEAVIASLAAVCEMLAPETHADVTARDYVKLAREAAKAARGQS